MQTSFQNVQYLSLEEVMYSKICIIAVDLHLAFKHISSLLYLLSFH